MTGKLYIFIGLNWFHIFIISSCILSFHISISQCSKCWAPLNSAFSIRQFPDLCGFFSNLWFIYITLICLVIILNRQFHFVQLSCWLSSIAPCDKSVIKWWTSHFAHFWASFDYHRFSNYKIPVFGLIELPLPFLFRKKVPKLLKVPSFLLNSLVTIATSSEKCCAHFFDDVQLAGSLTKRQLASVVLLGFSWAS